LTPPSLISYIEVNSPRWAEREKAMKVRKNPQSVFFVGQLKYGGRLGLVERIYADNSTNALFVYVAEKNEETYSKLDEDAQLVVYAGINEETFTIVELDEDKTDDAPEEPETGQLEAVADNA
jgi:hypothetical protein